MPSVIFLDIDGVLNSNFWNDRHHREISDGMRTIPQSACG